VERRSDEVRRAITIKTLCRSDGGLRGGRHRGIRGKGELRLKNSGLCVSVVIKLLPMCARVPSSIRLWCAACLLFECKLVRFA
jgi:hypothetical protein